MEKKPKINRSVESPQEKFTLARRHVIFGAVVLSLGGWAGREASKSPRSAALTTDSMSVGTNANLRAETLFRSEPDLEEPEPTQSPDPKPEPSPEPEPKPEPPKETEPPKPEKPTEPRGLEIFKSWDLPGVVVDRIRNEGLMKKVDAQRAIYDNVQNKRSVPWQLMAAINYREASLRPELSMKDGSSLHAGVSQDGVPIYPDAKKDAVSAADIFIGNAKRNYNVDITNINSLNEEQIAQALLAYNRGAMYLNNPGGPMPVSKSPYVYNYLKGGPMKWTRADSYDGSTRLNRMYDRGQSDGNLGALAIVAYLVQNK